MSDWDRFRFLLLRCLFPSTGVMYRCRFHLEGTTVIFPDGYRQFIVENEINVSALKGRVE